MENPIKMDDLGVPLFLETPKCSRMIKKAFFLVRNLDWILPYPIISLYNFMISDISFHYNTDGP